MCSRISGPSGVLGREVRTVQLKPRNGRSEGREGAQEEKGIVPVSERIQQSKLETREMVHLS